MTSGIARGINEGTEAQADIPALKCEAFSVWPGACETPLTCEEAKAITRAQCVGKVELLECGPREMTDKKGLYMVEVDRPGRWQPIVQIQRLLPAGRLDNNSPEALRLAMGPPATHDNYGNTLRRFHDIGVVYWDGSIATTIACRGVVIQGFTPSALQSNMSDTDPEVRKLGRDFCRVGLPKVHFMKIYSAIAWHHPEIQKNVKETDRYGRCHAA